MSSRIDEVLGNTRSDHSRVPNSESALKLHRERMEKEQA